MFKKTALAVATASLFGLSALAIATPAEAGFWYGGAYVDHPHGWEHYHCHWENRQVTVFRHGFPHIVNEQVRVCVD